MARLIDQIVGHREIWTHLRSIAERGHLPHAMTFAGPSGVGKRLLARALAQSLLCERRDKPCGECGPCRRVARGQSEGVLEITPEKNQIKIDAARAVLSFLNLARVTSVRFVVIDGAERLNPQAANACLKVIEEPPPGTHFVLITPEASQLMATVRSRAQTVRFGALDARDLTRGIQITSQSDEVIEDWILRAAAGSFERLASFRDPEVAATREAALSFLRDSLRGGRGGMNAVAGSAKDRERTLAVIQFLQRHLRDWVAGALTLDDERAANERVELWRHAQRMEHDFNAHVDRGLLFENFFNHARGVSA